VSVFSIVHIPVEARPAVSSNIRNVGPAPMQPAILRSTAASSRWCWTSNRPASPRRPESPGPRKSS
jgi:hypothetical protein